MFFMYALECNKVLVVCNNALECNNSLGSSGEPPLRVGAVCDTMAYKPLVCCWLVGWLFFISHRVLVGWGLVVSVHFGCSCLCMLFMYALECNKVFGSM